MQCNGEAPYTEMHCHFNQISILKMGDEERQKARAETDNEIAKMTKKDIADSFKSFAKADDLDKVEKRLLAAPTEEKRAYLEHSYRIFRDMLAVKDKAQMKQVMNRMNQEKEETCNIWFNEFDATFRRLTKNKWVSNPGAGGLCNVVTVMTLENMPEYDNLWKFTQVVASSDNDGLCKGIQTNTPAIYVWDAPTELALKCKYLAFGLP